MRGKDRRDLPVLVVCRNPNLKAIMPHNFYILVGGKDTIAKGMERAWRWFDDKVGLADFMEGYRFYTAGNKEMEKNKQFLNYKITGGEQVEGEGVLIDQQYQIYLDMAGISGGGPKVKGKISKPSRDEEEDKGKGKMTPPERRMWLMAKVRNNIEEGAFGSPLAQRMQQIAAQVFTQKTFFQQAVAQVQDTKAVKGLVKHWDDRPNRIAQHISRSLVEKLMPDFDGVARSYEMMCEAYEAAYIAEFFKDDTFDNMGYKGYIDAKLETLMKRDEDELARLQLAEQRAANGNMGL